MKSYIVPSARRNKFFFSLSHYWDYIVDIIVTITFIGTILLYVIILFSPVSCSNKMSMIHKATFSEDSDYEKQYFP